MSRSGPCSFGGRRLPNSGWFAYPSARLAERPRIAPWARGPDYLPFAESLMTSVEVLRLLFVGFGVGAFLLREREPRKGFGRTRRALFGTPKGARVSTVTRSFIRPTSISSHGRRRFRAEPGMTRQGPDDEGRVAGSPAVPRDRGVGQVRGTGRPPAPRNGAPKRRPGTTRPDHLIRGPVARPLYLPGRRELWIDTPRASSRPEVWWPYRSLWTGFGPIGSRFQCRIRVRATRSWSPRTPPLSSSGRCPNQ